MVLEACGELVTMVRLAFCMRLNVKRTTQDAGRRTQDAFELTFEQHLRYLNNF